MGQAFEVHVAAALFGEKRREFPLATADGGQLFEVAEPFDASAEHVPIGRRGRCQWVRAH